MKDGKLNCGVNSIGMFYKYTAVDFNANGQQIRKVSNEIFIELELIVQHLSRLRH